MRRITIFCLFLLNCFSMLAQDVTGHVVEGNNGEAVPYATILVEYSDTVEGRATDTDGLFAFTPRSYPLTIKAQAVGMSAAVATLTQEPDSAIVMVMESQSYELREVTVAARRRLTRLTDQGIRYDMTQNQRAQQENTLQALSYVPLLSVSADGDITVLGSPQYSLYVNGRPHDMAQTAPKTFLSSLPAADIDHVEVVTNGTTKYGPMANKYIINIVLRWQTVEGYVVSAGGGGDIQPKANASLMATMKRKNVDVSLSYDYGLNGQRHQPTDFTYSQPTSYGTSAHTWQTTGNGNGDWHTHTVRAMMSWRIDSVNTIYADAHGRINQTNTDAEWTTVDLLPTMSAPYNHQTYRSHYTTGTAEVNVIYRNYLRQSEDTERLMIGYRYTYNPDRRQVEQTWLDNATDFSSLEQRTTGGMQEHSVMASYVWKVAKGHMVRLTAKDMYRYANTHYRYDYSDDTEPSDYSMRYSNNIARQKLSYGGGVGRFSLQASIALDEDYFHMRLPESDGQSYSRTRLYAMPTASAYWFPSSANIFQLSYSTTVIRPTVQMLNPFAVSNNTYAVTQGNPDLKAQYAHDVSLVWMWNGLSNLSLYTDVGFSHAEDVILPMSYSDGQMQRNTYANIGHSNQLQLMMNLNWQTCSWLTLAADGRVGRRWLRSSELSLHQADTYFSAHTQATLLLPAHLRLAAQWGIYKNAPSPWTEKNSLKMYSLHLSQSFLKGRLTVTLKADQPFGKYIKMTTTTTLPDLQTRQVNYMTGRTFGINATYSFGGGKKVDIKRDRTMQSSDQQTGVR